MNRVAWQSIWATTYAGRTQEYILSQLDGAVRYPGMAGSLVESCRSCSTRLNTNNEGRQAARISKRKGDETCPRAVD